MPKTLLVSGFKISPTNIFHPDVDNVSSFFKDLSITDIPQKKYNAAIMDVHGRHPSIEKGEFLIWLFGQEEGKPKIYALQQILALQQKTGATDLFLLSCYGGALINQLARMRPEELQKLGFKTGTKIMVFSSSSNASLSSKSSDIIKKIVEHGSVVSEELAREVSINYAVTVKSCQINENGECKIRQKHNLHKYPELYMQLTDPENDFSKGEWRYASERFNYLSSQKKRGSNFLEGEKEELKKLKEMFTLYNLYKDNPLNIPESFPDDALIESANRGKIRRLEQWISTGSNIDCTDKNGNTPLIIAIEDDVDIHVILTLLAKGANPNLPNNDGKTPLFEAIEYGRNDIVEALLRYDANPNIPNALCQTPLMMAAKNNDMKLAAILLEKNVNVGAVDNFNRTAIMYATNSDLIKILENAHEKQIAASSPEPTKAIPLKNHLLEAKL